MDEGTLEASILTYKQQLQQVETVLLSAGSEGQHELLQLKEDLEQVIQLTQESLLSLKKSKLLSLVDGISEDPNDSTKSTGSPTRDTSQASVFPPSNDHSSDKFDEEYAAFQAAIASENDNSESQGASVEPSRLRQGEDEDGEAGLEEDGEGDNEDISGTKCSVYHTEEWGGRQRHNAVVLCVEPTVNLDEEACLRVLFCNPTTTSMKPCPYFLGGTCRFTVDDCRFSHGYLVKLSEIHSFQEPDFSLLKLEALCLAKYSDGIWYPASIQHIDHDQHQVIVQYESYGTTTTLDVESILPSTQSSDTSPSLSSSDNDNSDDDDNDDSNDANLPSTSYSRGGTAADEDDFPQIAWTPSGGGVALGEWEAHTRGIGSKLMAKMGYEFGKGLGRNGEGRVEPVEAVVIPQGKTLDVCMELREMKKLGIVGKPKKKRSKGKSQGHNARSSTSTGHSHKKKENVFDFINWKLGGKKTKLTELIQQNNIGGREFLEKNCSKDGSEENPSRKLNIQLVRTQEDIRSTERKLVRLRESLQRNQRDKLTASKIEGKIEGAERLLGNLRSSEKKIQRQRNTRDQHRKLTVF